MKRSTLVATIIFLGLLAAAVVALQKKPERGISRLSFTALDKSAITALELSGKQNVKLKRDGAGWVLENGRQADAAAVERAIDALLKIHTSDLVGSSSERFTEYEVTEEQGLRVRLFKGQERLLDLTLGKSAQGGSAYVRRGDEVFQVAQFSPAQFNRPAGSWQMLKLFNEQLSDVARVEVSLQRPPSSYALVKRDGKWSFDDPSVVPANFRFDEAAASSLVSTLVNLSAKEFLSEDPGAEKSGLGDPDVVAFTGKDGARHELRLGATAEGQAVYAKVGSGGDTVTLHEYSAKALRKGATDLRDLSLAKLDANRLMSLQLKTPKGSLTLEKKDGQWALANTTEKRPADYEFDPAKADRWVTAVTLMRASRVATKEESAKAGLAKPSAQLTATLDDGSTASISLGADLRGESGEMVFARGTLDNETYVAAKWLKDELTGGLAHFKK